MFGDQHGGTVCHTPHANPRRSSSSSSGTRVVVACRYCLTLTVDDWGELPAWSGAYRSLWACSPQSDWPGHGSAWRVLTLGGWVMLWLVPR
jgi:hypothetical protein